MSESSANSEFERLIWGRLDAMERTQAWLARQLGLHRQRLHRYMTGQTAWPDAIRLQVEELLDIRAEEVAA